MVLIVLALMIVSSGSLNPALALKLPLQCKLEQSASFQTAFSSSQLKLNKADNRLLQLAAMCVLLLHQQFATQLSGSLQLCQDRAKLLHFQLKTFQLAVHRQSLPWQLLRLPLLPEHALPVPDQPASQAFYAQRRMPESLARVTNGSSTSSQTKTVGLRNVPATAANKAGPSEHDTKV